MSRCAVLVGFVVLLVVLAGCTGGVGGGQDATRTPTTGVVAAQNETTTGAGGPNGTLAVHVIDVGQGAATLVVGPTGETMLVDSGNWRDDGQYVLDYLRRLNVTRIDALVTTHADADHIGGHAAVIRYYETQADGVGAVYDPGIASSSQVYGRYLDAVERYNVTLYRTRAGDSIPLPGADVSVLAPPETDLAGGDRNSNSLVLRVAFGRTSVLLTGDAERAEEDYLVQRYGSGLHATVLQAGHHGSRSSSGPTFLDAVSPAAVVVSSDYDSQYGHPHQEVLDRLAARDIPTFWTAVHGTVVFESDGRTMTVLAQQPATTDPLALRSAEPVALASPLPERQVAQIAGQLVTQQLGPTAETSTTVATDGGANGTGGLRLVRVHADAAGDDRTNLNDEYLVFANDGPDPLALGGWTVEDAAGHRYTVPAGVELPPGETLTLHTGTGSDAGTDYYCGSGEPIWNNGGDTVIVRRPDGTTALEEPY